MSMIPENKRIIFDTRPSHWLLANTYMALLVGIAVSIYLARDGGSHLIRVAPVLAEHPEFLAYFSLGMYGIGGLMSLMLVYAFINLSYTRYVLTEDTLYTRQNFLQGSYNTLWTHLIRDVSAELPLHMRMIGLGNVVIKSLDRTHPRLVLRGLRDARQIKSTLNDLARIQGAAEGVRSLDMG